MMNENNPKLYKLLAFVAGALSSVNISIFGLISYSELIMLLLLPSLLLFKSNNFKAFSLNEKYTTLMILLWLLAIVLSDIINGTQLNLFLKGIGHPIMIFVSFLFFNRILQFSTEVIKYFVWGLVIASILFYLTDKVAQEYFRFGVLNIIFTITFVFIYDFWGKGNYKTCYLLLIFVMIFGFLNGGRSNGLNILLLIILLISSGNLFKNKKIIEYKNITKFAIIALILSVIVQEIYVFSVKNKAYTDQYQAKFEEQLNTGLPALLSGRTEIFSSFAAIKDSPIVGHGSWSKDLKYTNIYYQQKKVDTSTFNDTSKAYGFDRIPSHSFIFGAWVEHGILAMLFFVFFAKRIINVLLLSLNNYNFSGTPYIIFQCIVNFWHLLFSPLGSDKRIFIGLILALNAYYVNINNK